jgi:hypothetical protein
VVLTKSRITRIQIAAATKHPTRHVEFSDQRPVRLPLIIFTLQCSESKCEKISLKRLSASKNAIGRESYKPYREIVSYYNTSEISM